MAEKFALDPKDVAYAGSRGSSGRKKARYSRANQVSQCEITLTHMPTGIEVKGEIKLGNYSRKEMKRLEDQLYERLFDSLEEAVARALRIPGR